MSSPEHQTSILMNNNDIPAEATSGRRLLSNSGEDKHASVPRTRMTRPSKFSVRAALVVLVIMSLAVAIIIIVTLTASPRPSDADDAPATPLSRHPHLRCLHDIIVGERNEVWRLYDSRSPKWKTFPKLNNTEYVLISPKYELEYGYPGVQVSAILPPYNEEVYIMAVTSSSEHTRPVVMPTRSKACESVVIQDPNLFGGNLTHFRVYVFFKHHVTLQGAKLTVTSLPREIKFKSMHYHTKITSNPVFSHIVPGVRDKCAVELVDRSKYDCKWWNIEVWDNADFETLDRHSCIRSGVQSSESASWFFSVSSKEGQKESRALLVSPIIERKTPSLLLTLWYMFKCDGPSIRIHLVPANKTFHKILGTSNLVAEITNPASHIDWKFVSFQIELPEKHEAYHIILEGVAPSDGECKGHACAMKGSQVVIPKSPMLGIDDITLELMHEQCNHSDIPNVMNCGFQNATGQKTTCGWTSSSPYTEDSYIFEEDYWDDWKPINSGDDSDHGATAQHFVGRGYIMSFDATGRRNDQCWVRTPILRANNDCACVMTFLYLMRGFFTPRLQVNILYGVDADDETRPLEPQWSLFGNQSHEWETAAIAINLKKAKPFQIEIRVLDVHDSQGDIHFDDIEFIGCDMGIHDA